MTARLLRISVIEASLRTCSDLHISSSEREFRASNIQQLVKHQDSSLPYIPGTTLKGVMRAQLELVLGLAALNAGEPLSIRAAQGANWPPGALSVLQLFGAQPYEENGRCVTLGPGRCSFHHAELNRDWIDDRNRRGLPITHWVKLMRIDRRSGEQSHSAELEVVPPGAIFNFRLALREYEGDDNKALLLLGLSHMIDRGLGSGVSRGFGRVALDRVMLDDSPIDLPDIYSAAVAVNS